MSPEITKEKEVILEKSNKKEETSQHEESLTFLEDFEIEKFNINVFDEIMESEILKYLSDEEKEEIKLEIEKQDIFKKTALIKLFVKQNDCKISDKNIREYISFVYESGIYKDNVKKIVWDYTDQDKAKSLSNEIKSGWNELTKEETKLYDDIIDGKLYLLKEMQKYPINMQSPEWQSLLKDYLRFKENSKGIKYMDKNMLRKFADEYEGKPYLIDNENISYSLHHLDDDLMFEKSIIIKMLIEKELEEDGIDSSKIEATLKSTLKKALKGTNISFLAKMGILNSLEEEYNKMIDLQDYESTEEIEQVYIDKNTNQRVTKTYKQKTLFAEQHEQLRMIASIQRKLSEEKWNEMMKKLDLLKVTI